MANKSYFFAAGATQKSMLPGLAFSGKQIINTMMNKENIFHEILGFFLNSNDYNGITLNGLSELLGVNYIDTIEVLKELVTETKISVQRSENPHIIGFGHYDIDKQIAFLEDAKKNKSRTISSFGEFKFTINTHTLCIYPSTSYLLEKRDVDEFMGKPYSKLLALGEPQLKPLFFEIEVLDKYFKDPRYRFDFKDYSGSIGCAFDENGSPLLTKPKDQIFLKTFGLGFDENNERASVVYLRYLGRLSSEHQLYWKDKEIADGCHMLQEYYANTLEGCWSFSYSIFAAFIEEHRILNELSASLSEEKLFKKSFEADKRPKEFTFFLLPTLENYYSFISLLDKMLSDNINKKFFDGKVELFELIELPNELVEKRNKGTLRLLEEWLRSNYNLDDDGLFKKIFQPLKKIRAVRQKPAHVISENEYDKGFNKKQMDLMEEVFFSIKTLRLIFQQHPQTKEISIPNWLEKGDIKIF